MKHMLTIKSWRTVSITILNEITVERQIVLCSSWSNVRTLTLMTELASMWSISCNIQHLTQQQGQHKTQWSMLRKGTFRHLCWANTANQKISPHVDIIKWMKATAARRQKGSDHWEHCPASDPKWSFPRWKDRKRTFQAMKRKRGGSRSMWREKPLWQESEFEMQRQWLCKSGKICVLLKTQERQPESPKKRSKSCWMVSETLWVMLDVPTMSTMGNMRKIMKKIQSAASRVMMNLAGWWAQSPKQYSTAWRVFGRSRWGLTNWRHQDGGTH